MEFGILYISTLKVFFDYQLSIIYYYTLDYLSLREKIIEKNIFVLYQNLIIYNKN